jgi:hypothetical protein
MKMNGGVGILIGVGLCSLPVIGGFYTSYGTVLNKHIKKRRAPKL